MARRIIAAFVAALLLAGGWYWGSPWWTLWQMREAARAGDMRRLAAYMDVPRIDANAKADFRRMWGSVLATPMAETEAAQQFQALARRKLAGADNEPGFSPEQVREWFADMPVRWGGLEGYIATEPLGPYIDRNGLQGFEVREEDADWYLGPLLTFRRDGLGWRLVAVRWGQQ